MLEFYLDDQLMSPKEYRDGITPDDCSDCLEGSFFEGLLPDEIEPGQHTLTLLVADAAPFPLLTRHDLDFEFVDQYEPILATPTADSPWEIDGSSYNLTVEVSDHSPLLRTRVRIDNSDRKGFFDWNPNGHSFSSDGVACAGDGFASKHPSETWGGDHVTLVACSSSRSGNTRTVTFTVQPNASFGEHASVPVSVRAWDTEGNKTVWTEFPGVFSSTSSNDSTPPDGYVDVPAPDAVLTGTTTFSGWAIDSSSVEQFRFFVDGAEVQLISLFRPVRNDVCDHPAWTTVGDPDCPYVGWQGGFDTTTVADGSHTLQVVALDPAGNSTSWHRSFIVDNGVGNDTTPPAGYVDVPSSGAVLAGTTTFSGWAIDSSSVDQFQFFVDGTEVTLTSFSRPGRPDVCDHPAWIPIGDPDCPYIGWQGSLDTTTVADGSHTLDVVAVDAAGNSTTWNRTFSTANGPNDTTAPEVWADGPGHSQVVSGNFRFHGWARDASSVDQFRFYMDGAQISLASFRRTGRNDACTSAAGMAVGDPDCPNIGWEGYFETASMPDGSHTFTVEAIDPYGNSETFNRYFSTDNVPNDTTAPEVWADGPGHSQVVSGNFRFHGWARDASSVDQFRFYMDGVQISLASFRRTGRNDACTSAAGLAVGDPDCPNVGWEGYFDTASIPDGSHTFTVEAIDPYGNAETFNRYFSTDNAP